MSCPAGSVPGSARETTTLIWLLGQPHLGTYLDFVAATVVDGDKLDRRGLTDEWRRANDLYHALEQSEAGIADSIGCLPPERSLAKRLDAVRASPWFRPSFDCLPTTILKVELDKLVVSQVHVEHGHSFRAAETAGTKLDPAALLDICLPIDPPLPPVRTQRLSENHYRFSSPSTDFRAHPLRLVDPPAPGVSGDFGPSRLMVALGIGFGSNFLSGIRSGSRIVLQNGYHRAYALRGMGATHAYCVVEDVTRKDELRLVASSGVGNDAEFYFGAARPPLLMDFFNPQLTKEFKVLPMINEIDVKVRVRSSMVTE